jgi:hypothetical protein
MQCAELEEQIEKLDGQIDAAKRIQGHEVKSLAAN